MSRDICNHVLLRVHHLANRLVVLLESRVFSSLAKLLHLATRIKVEHNTNFSGILGFGRLFKRTNWSCRVWHSWQACHVGAFGKMNLSFPWQHQAWTIRNSNEPSFTSSRTERTRNFRIIPEDTKGDPKDHKKAMESLTILSNWRRTFQWRDKTF